jgi:polyisoprenoid-binding protein YceI
MRSAIGGSWIVALCVCLFCGLPAGVSAQVPTYEISGGNSEITFGVDSSVPIKGTFNKWTATMKFTSANVKSGVLDIVIQADSVDTGSGLKNNKLKGKDFFNVKESPTITFRSKQDRTPLNSMAISAFVALRRWRNSV